MAYAFAQAPAITSFSPLTTASGATVTITGSGFNGTPANNIVYVGAVKAAVSASSATSLTITVPAGATYGYITELNTTTYQVGYSGLKFTPTFGPAKGSITLHDFAAKIDNTTGTSPFSVVMGDIDGDGKPDMVVSNSGVATVSVFLNTGSIGNPSFAAKADFTVGANARSLAIGDLDGDGKLDLAIGNYNNSTVSVLRNTSSIGTATFATKVDLTTGTNTYSVAIGDIDGDGRLDIVAANYTSGTISVLLNTGSSGTISFAAKADFATGINPQNIAIGDFDGDGKPDVAVVNNGATTVSVLHNISSVSTLGFDAKIDFTIGNGARSVAVGDFDGDGKLDLAVANYTSNTISLLRNISSSSVNFAAKIDLATASQPTTVSIGDLDGDGKPDLAVSNNGASTVSVFRNTTSSSTLSFATKVDFATGSAPQSVAIGDIDGDGKPDLAAANFSSASVSVLLNTYNTDLAALTISAGTLSPAFAAATTNYSASLPNTTTSITITPTRSDVNQTLQIQINNGGYNAITSGSASSALALNVGANTINIKVTALDGTTTKVYSTTVIRTDIAPVITAYTPLTGAVGTSVTITGTGFNTTTGNNLVFFGAARAVVTAANATSLTVTVPNGATYGYVTELNTATGLATYSGAKFNPTFTPNKGSIVITDFAAKIDNTTGTSPFTVVIGDIDGDGKPDMAVSNAGVATVSVFLNTGSSGSPSFAAKADFTVGTNARSLAIGDLDGDGKLDLAVGNYNTNTVSILRNTSSLGAISFAAKVDLTTGTNPYSVAIGDIDGDGRLDIVSANYTSSTVSVFLNTGSSGAIAFATKSDFVTGTNPQSVAIGDLDGDGKPDVAVANNGATTVSVLRNTSNANTLSFDAKIDATIGSGARSIAIGDIDGDGKLDIAASNYTSNTISVLRNTSSSGSVSFAAKVDLTTASQPTTVAIGDLDGDGKPDLAVSNNGASTISVFRNTGSSGTVTFATKVDLASGGAPQSVAIGDLDGDGKLDLASANFSSATASVIRNTPLITPTVQATNVVFANTATTTTTASWTIGNGSARAVFMAAVTTGNAAPINATTYTANTAFGSGTQIGATGWYCVYNGTGTSVNITGLASGNTYRVMVVEYGGAAGTELYLTTGATGNPANIALVPIITTNGSLSALSSTYGASSASGSFNVSGTGMTAGILVTPPSGFEVSTDNIAFTSTVTVGSTGTIASTPVYIRLKASATPGAYSGDVVLSSTNATSVNVATVSSTVAKAPLTITADNQTKIYGAVVPTLTATYSGFVNGDTQTGFTTLPIISTIATTTSFVSGSPYSITVIGAVSSNYDIIYVAGNLTVTPAPLTIAAVNATKTYGASNPTLTVSYTGFVGTDDASSLSTQPTITTTAIVGSVVGIYSITASGAVSANYTIGYTAATLTINQAALTITADDQTKIYGAALPALTATYNGFVNGDTPGNLTSQPSISTIATPGSAVGNYPITISGASASNYNISYTAGTLAVSPAPLTITATNASKIYGSVNPALAVNYSGFVGTDDETGLTTQPTIATTAVTTSAVGTYPITASGALGNNYIISYIAATLTIDKAALTIIATSTSKVYGTVNPTLAVTYSGFTGADNAATLTTQPGISTTATTLSFVGAYPITVNGASASNYNISYTGGSLTVTPATLTITANDVSKLPGNSLIGGAGSSAFVANGLVGSETVGTVTITYGNGAAAGDTQGIYTGQVTPSLLAGGNFTASNYNITYVKGDIVVGTSVLLTSGTPTALTTSYGTASGNTNFSVSGSNLSGNITVIPPTGFEVSTSANNSFTGSIVLTPIAGTVSSTTVFLRLSATAAASTYSGDVILTSSGAATATVATASSIINTAPLTITASNVTKTYGQTIAGGSGSIAFVAGSGLKNGNTISSVTITYGAGSAATAGANTYPAVVVSSTAIGGNGFLASNYNITYTAGNIIVNPATLNITANNASKTYGATNPALAVTYTGFVNGDTQAGLSTQPTVSTTALTTSGVNTYPITASGAVSSNYNISYTAGTLTITPAALTITVVNANKTYGAVNPALAVTYSGFVGSDNAAGLIIQPGISTTALTGSPVGTYAVTASGAASANYTISYIAGTLTINPASLTITATNNIKTYGTVNPTLLVSYNGFVNGDTQSNLNIQPTVSTTALTASPVGNYPIMVTGAALANYNISYVAGSLTVAQAALIITASSAGKTYGTANPTLPVTYSGFVGTDNAASLTAQPTVSTTAVTASTVGAYPITASGAASANYTISYIAGILTVTPAPLTITANNQSRTIGQANPTLTVTYNGFVNGDTPATLTSPPVISTIAIITSPVGVYPITASGAIATNYAITYVAGTLTVTAQGNANLASLAVNNGTLSPVLVQGTTAYILAVANAITSITVTPTTADANATVRVNGSTVISGTPSASLPLAVGNNIITTIVTAQDGVTKITYTITVIRAPSANANLSFVTISNGSLSPIFSSATTQYTTGVGNTVTDISITPTLADATATLTVNGKAVVNGLATTVGGLVAGDNSVTIVVTAQDGVTKIIYVIVIHKAAPPEAITATNILSPNGDGKNDNWSIKDILLYPNNSVTVYDRGGRIVFTKKGYTNDWEGTINGSPLSEDTYYYVVDLGVPLTKPFTGFITILRSRK
jgi:gliding motility-associated-like protein